MSDFSSDAVFNVRLKSEDFSKLYSYSGKTYCYDPEMTHNHNYVKCDSKQTPRIFSDKILVVRFKSEDFVKLQTKILHQK